MSENNRTQLTLFVNSPESEIIDEARRLFNPIQHYLIKPHITLCREQEIYNIEKILKNLENIKFSAFSLQLGKPTRFKEANGIYLPVLGDVKQLNTLRNIVLNGVIEIPNQIMPHITIMHPRNSSCTDEIFNQLISRNFPKLVTFDRVSLITQHKDEKWHIVKDFPLLAY